MHLQEARAQARTRLAGAGPTSPRRGASRASLTLLPELARFVPAEQDRALRRARETPLDLLELATTAVALVAVTALTRYALADATLASRLLAAAANFAVALPLLAIAIAPLHVRRLRRGLRRQLAKQSPP